jgi:hypothetical protein
MSWWEMNPLRTMFFTYVSGHLKSQIYRLGHDCEIETSLNLSIPYQRLVLHEMF